MRKKARAKAAAAKPLPPADAPAPALVGTDDDIADQLFAALDSGPAPDPAPAPAPAPAPPSASSPPHGPAAPRPSRQKARLARREQQQQQLRDSAAAEAALLPDPAAAEAADIAAQCAQLNVALHHVPPDGHCLYAALADQLNIRQPAPQPYSASQLRAAAARYMRAHPDDFMPFISDLDVLAAPLPSPDAPSANPTDKYACYCDAVEHSALWGGQPEILALSHVFRTPIHIVQSASPVLPIGDHYTDHPPLLVSYHLKMYGLGEHYNSLRPIS
ncbi:ubiquitinyl hydrolase 1 [Malassezia cuniculi]|uniref:Ubiquitinyl hydrolase 1 n=1 Tax=Malassezia cuniculi TaxID=948313 RepID=A0AAF0JC14_9BASI|nr:ubiquitinyl hydrolase 1 [Malassezia cuniculi]